MGLKESTAYDRRSRWVPPPRPEWMAKLNELGRGLELASIVPLTPSSLIVEATQNTGLSDFGGRRWRQHFEMLMKAVDEEAKLHFAGRLLTRCEMLLYLEGRLQIINDYKRHPQIDDERIDRPMFITGFARSGTTILFEVLGQDPQFRIARKWEALFPSPPPRAATYKIDPRIEKAEHVGALLDAMTPEFQAAHRVGAELPIESLETEYSAFLSDVYPIVFQIPSYAKYLSEQDLSEAFEWQKKTMKLLQWHHRGTHWLMKSPSHLPHLRKVLNVFPGMRVIFAHRDPVVTADSVVSVMGTLYWLRTDEPWGNGAIESWSLSMAQERASAWSDIIAMIEAGQLAKGSFANFHYAEFMTDPIQSIRKIYRDFDMILSPKVEGRMLAFLDSKTQGKFGKHQYEHTPVDVIDRERDAYARYQKFFGVKTEI
jgi:hypothetical protein